MPFTAGPGGSGKAAKQCVIDNNESKKETMEKARQEWNGVNNIDELKGDTLETRRVHDYYGSQYKDKLKEYREEKGGRDKVRVGIESKIKSLYESGGWSTVLKLDFDTVMKLYDYILENHSIIYLQSGRLEYRMHHDQFKSTDVQRLISEIFTHDLIELGELWCSGRFNLVGVSTIVIPDGCAPPEENQTIHQDHKYGPNNSFVISCSYDMEQKKLSRKILVP